jgi:hypothetical protein
MPEPNIETFQASIMIVASFGSYLAVSGHDHAKVRPEGVPHVRDTALEAGDTLASERETSTVPHPAPRRLSIEATMIV